MRHPERGNRQLADGKPHHGPQPTLPPQLPQNNRQQRKQHQILHHAHTGDGHNAEQRPQPDQVAVPIPRIGERHQLHCLLGTGGQRNGALAIDSKITGHRFKVIHVIGRCGHHGGQGILLAHGGRFKQHDGIGIVIHLEQLKAEIFRVKPLLLDGLG